MHSDYQQIFKQIIMKKYIKIISLISFLAFTTSCEKEIELNPEDVIATDQFYQNANDAESGLAACYNKTFSFDVYGKILFYSDISSDDIRAYNDGGDLSRLERRSELIATNGEAGSFWNGCYNALANINLLLEKVPAIPDNAFLKQRKAEIIGEAKFLRAYIYWNLLQFYGGVPIILNFPTSGSRPENQFPRNTAAEVLTQIKTDLTEAETVLPYIYVNPTNAGDVNYTLTNSKGRANKGAAKALLIRILLSESKWAEVAAKAQEITASNTYQLNARYSPIFRAEEGARQNTVESILESQASNLPGQFDNTGVLKFFYTGSPIYGATEDLYNTYDTGTRVDVRRERNAVRVEGPLRYYASKYKNFYSDLPNDHYILFRYAEVLINRAEALNELGYPNQEALNIINSLRSRARDIDWGGGPTTGIAPLTLADVPNQQGFRQAIRNEKRREFTQEGLRWFDLLRWDKNLALQATGVTDQNKLLFPIPQGEIDKNPKLTQNPGY